MNETPPSSSADASVQEWQRGRPRAFERVVRPHIRPLRRHLTARFRDPVLADEATSDALLKAWKNRERYVHRGSFRAWLFTLGRRAALDRLRARGARGRLGEKLLALPEPAPPTGPDAPLERRDVRARLARALAKLPERHRRAVELRYGLDLTTPEVADELGITPRRARDRLAYALRRLRREPALAA